MKPKSKHLRCRTYFNLLDTTNGEGDYFVAVSATAALPEKPHIPWWLWPNVLSLDAPLVAVLWQEALSRAHHVKLLPGCNLALGLAVWLIYIVDRVLDGCGAPRGEVLSPRHAFYRRHRIWFVVLVIPALSAWLLYVALWVLRLAGFSVNS